MYELSGRKRLVNQPWRRPSFAVQDRVRRVPRWPGGAEPRATGRHHSAQTGVCAERVPGPKGALREDEGRPVRQAEAAGGEQGEDATAVTAKTRL